MAYAGRCLAQRRRYLLCMVVAGIACIFMPFGTALGVFTLVVLSRPAVKAAFETA
jgi:disulfide bond formation protein DsbB